MIEKIKMFQMKFNSLTKMYIDSYNGKQPIMTIYNDAKIKIEPAFLNHLPSNIKAAIEVFVKEANDV